MNSNRPRSLSVVTIATTLFVIAITSLLLAASISLISSYNFDVSLAKRSQYIISSGIQSGALPFAMGTEDEELILSIVNSYMQYEEVYAIEIKDVDKQIILRREKESSGSPIEITTKALEIVAPYESLSVDTLSDTAIVQPTLGYAVLYFTNENVKSEIIDQVAFSGSVLFISIVIIGFLLLLFNKVMRKHLNRTLQTMESIKNGEKIEWDDQRFAPDLREMRILYYSFKDLSVSINDRDAQLKESLTNALNAKNAVEEAEKFKDEFIRAICHDIKTPVGVVLNLLALLEEDSKKYDLRKSFIDKLEACHRSAQVLNDVTTELFDFDQFQNMELLEKPESILVTSLFDRISAMYSNQFKKANINFTVRYAKGNSDGPDLYIFIDYKKVTLIIENLVDNAFKFTRDGSVTIEWELIDSSLLVNVKDSGIGISEDKLKLIFHKHTQLEDIKTTRHSGRGLGLYYVDRLVETIGATIEVDSRRNIGSSFSVKIPCRLNENKVIKKPTFSNVDKLSINDSKPFDITSLKVLVIDDDEDTCFTLSEMLLQQGIKCVTECIPEIGFRRLISERPDLVFIDYHMSGLSGDELAKKAQSIVSENATFYVCITAESNADSITMLNGIFNEVYLKPFSMVRLDEILNGIINSRKEAIKIISTLRDG